MNESPGSTTPIWRVAGGRVVHPAPFCILGILNATPDSFYDGGRYDRPDTAVAQAVHILDAGADILDIGGESTRPYAEPVGAAEEIERVVPVIGEVLERSPEALISVDTYKGATAEAALQAGACIVNDVSGCRYDPALLPVLTSCRPGYVLMHSQGRPSDMQDAPRYGDVVDEVMAFFVDRMQWLTGQGLPEEHIVLDPGIGFGKTLEHNLALLRHVERLQTLGRPVLMGLSNKSLWSKLLGLEGAEREWATQVATALLAARGVTLHRVHDAGRSRQSLQLMQAITPTAP
ncbi:dihydropteroate synthase [Desulfohalobium retbaense]|uniref:Dihydropteroate synthase n=1 Tax=Desulfohalobium retbaense (strain ATCC 49708 / DSM 5692 / JCM 16813 / HR100) TaxID=485915 RepID=C8X3L3_DESRD|nr:dihydropteroate synthase [Desulfohalobium retbaense]ACV69010.1 dihydropteroate synthase [Desulfohalobium retbaense DSM 5692]